MVFFEQGIDVDWIFKMSEDVQLGISVACPPRASIKFHFLHSAALLLPPRHCSRSYSSCWWRSSWWVGPADEGLGAEGIFEWDLPRAAGCAHVNLHEEHVRQAFHLLRRPALGAVKKMDENDWKWMKMIENGWKWLKMDESEWTWMNMIVLRI